jgi:serine/threonine protein kinase
MSDQVDCPSPGELHQALNGELSRQQFDAIEEHLLNCGPCAEKTLCSGELETYSHALRNSVQRSETVGAAESQLVEQLIVRLRAFPLQQDATLTSDTEAEARDHQLKSDLCSYLRPAETAAEIGWLGGYRVLKLLGSGGMGGVFLAEDTQLNRRVALKVMRPDVSEKLNSVERFLREARAAAAVHHDHIITIYQVGRDEQIPFLAMEYLDGESLEDRLRTGPPLPLSDVLRIGREIAEGLAAAHSRGLVHRDIKPANIWLEARGNSNVVKPDQILPPRVKLLDFGLARPAEANFELTSQGAIIGTPAYMAPEQAGGLTIDHRADLFSLGVVLYRLATGKFPFKGSDAIATLVAIRSETPLNPRQINPELPPSFAELILQLLAKAPADRPNGAAEVARQLASIEAAPELPPVPVAVPISTLPVAVPPQLRARSWNKFLAVALPLLCVLAGVIVFTDQGQIVVKTPDEDVDVKIVVTRQDGSAITAYDRQTGSKVKWLWSGTYNVELQGDANSVELDKNSFTLKRGQREVLTLIRKPQIVGSMNVPPPIPIASVAKRSESSGPLPLNEWLKGRQILTVAQDGSAQYRTIAEALAALKPHQVVKVLDRGPYQELLRLPFIADDTGLITDQRTILETLPAGPGTPDGKAGMIFGPLNGFRLSGFRILGPPDQRSIRWRSPSGLVLEDCCFAASQPLNPIRTWPTSLSFEEGEVQTQPIVVRNCMFDNAGIEFRGSVPTFTVERNYFFQAGITVEGPTYKRIVARHNVFDASVGAFWFIKVAAVSDGFEIVNNTIVGMGHGSFLVFTENAPQRGGIIHNNLAETNIAVKQVPDGVESIVKKQWQVGSNGYTFPDTWPLAPTDVLGYLDFLSVNNSDRNYLRLPPDSRFAGRGAAGKWPEYMGALPPGPAPIDGDWFTRLRDRWVTDNSLKKQTSPPARLPEVAPLADWLKGREILTVTQDGSGQHQSITSAIRALKPGQVIRVLDRGPYREHLRFADLPADTGLISDQQTIIETEAWKGSSAAHEMGPLNGFRFSGFQLLAPCSADASKITNWIQPSGLIIEDCAFGRRPDATLNRGPEASIQIDFQKGGPGIDPVLVRNCLFDHGSIGVNAPEDSDTTVVVTQNYFYQGFIGLKWQIGTVIVRQNLFENSEASMLSMEHVTIIHKMLEISNNTAIDTRRGKRNSGIHFLHNGPLDRVVIRNNVTDSGVYLDSTEHQRRRVSERWQMDHNATVRDWGCFPKSPTDVLLGGNEIKTAADDKESWLIPATGPIAMGGAGGTWPAYLGALPPGPAPADGDWLSKLQARWMTTLVKDK